MEGSQKKVLRDTVVEVDLIKLSSNIKSIREMVGSDVSIMAVVKADGYGHGAAEISETIMDSGADYLAVATLTEALELRKVHNNYPIFILGHTPDMFLRQVVQNDITQTIFSLHQARLIDQISQSLSKKAKVHLKVDTGFHRLGQIPSQEYLEEIISMFSLPNIDIEGIFTHLALVNHEENQKQFNLFIRFVNQIEQEGRSIKYKHVADSIACVDFPEYWLNMIRPGALIYGMRGYHKGSLPVEQVIKFKSVISQIHHIKKGEGVGYDYLWKAETDSTIATMPFGYADGYPRNLRSKGYVVIRGRRAPIIGVICMDQCMADVTDIPQVEEGDQVIIYGDGKDGSMTIDEAALLAETNKNDIISRLSMRSPRVYIKNRITRR